MTKNRAYHIRILSELRGIDRDSEELQEMSILELLNAIKEERMKKEEEEEEEEPKKRNYTAPSAFCGAVFS